MAWTRESEVVKRTLGMTMIPIHRLSELICCLQFLWMEKVVIHEPFTLVLRGSCQIQQNFTYHVGVRPSLQERQSSVRIICTWLRTTRRIPHVFKSLVQRYE